MRLMPFACRFTVFTLTFIFSCYASFSQKKEFKGYYISQEGDTVKGVFPGYKQWNINPDKISFIPQSGNQVELTPLTCKEFQIEDIETYITYHGPRLKNPIDFSSATGDNKDSFETITTFLRQIATTPEYRFYVYKDELRINLYYANKDKAITELLQKGAVINNNFWESMTYKQQLKELFPDENKKEKTDNVAYTEESITAFINNSNGRGKSLKKVKKENDGFVIMAGASLNSFKFSGDKSFDYSNKDYPSNFVPLIAAGYMVSINRNFNSAFLFPQLKVYSFKHAATTYYNTSTPYPALENTFESATVVSFAFHIGYNLVNKPNLRVFVAPGGGASIAYKNKQTDHTIFTATEERSKTTPMPSGIGLLTAQAGVIVKNKFLVSSSYNLPTSVTSTSSPGSLSSIQFTIGYKL